MSIGAFSQKKNDLISNKGKVFLYWGWNRGFYSDSDITFKGNDYDFTLNKATASDKPTPFSFDKYLNPANMTIPQTNYRIGYFFKENYTISLGVDHMKYVLDQGQQASITGEIDPVYAPHDGVYNGELKEITDDFIQFEHTDGLNYICIEVNRFDNISPFLGIHSKNFQINVTEGLGAGALLPRTNATLLGNERHDEFHLAGFGVSAQVGLDFTFFKYFFIMSELKGGYINMGDIRTTQSKSDTASQSFWYVEPTFVFGGRFRLF
mgnify:CR=1 FL=1